MIVRNEAATITKCLASVRPWVDRMLVLDTGSVDGTQQIAQRAGARVEHFQWCDDFSAARNVSLELAAADWHVVLDADETLAHGGATLALLRNMRPDFVGNVRQDNHFEQAGAKGFASSWIPRILPAGVRYQGRIHEQPVHGLELRRLDVHLDHSGYTPAALSTKDGRNAALLERSLQDTPKDGYLLYQLAKEHSVYQRYAQALEYFASADQWLAPDLAITHDLLLRWLFALKKCGRHEEAIHLAQERMARWELSPDYWFTLGDLLLDWACEQPQRHQELMPMIEASWLRCLEIGERPDLEGSVQGRGSYLAAANLAVVYDGLGRSDEARKYRSLAAANPRPDGQ
jgi:tetratricopeptide (TPR) repeat protein